MYGNCAYPNSIFSCFSLPLSLSLRLSIHVCLSVFPVYPSILPLLFFLKYIIFLSFLCLFNPPSLLLPSISPTVYPSVSFPQSLSFCVFPSLSVSLHLLLCVSSMYLPFQSTKFPVQKEHGIPRHSTGPRNSVEFCGIETTLF
jgi:hypothetical protein